MDLAERNAPKSILLPYCKKLLLVVLSENNEITLLFRDIAAEINRDNGIFVLGIDRTFHQKAWYIP